MSHHIYQTTGLILETKPAGEANKVYTVFTKDLGLIQGIAQGVRYSKSKLRFSLQQFSYVNLSIVRGKHVWRLVNAGEIVNFYTQFKNQPELLVMIARVLSLIKRLIQGEEKNETLFEYIIKNLEYLTNNLQTNNKLTLEQIRNIEYILVLTILSDLGYLRAVPELQPFVDVPLSAELVDAMNTHARVALKEINSSLKESQL